MYVGIVLIYEYLGVEVYVEKSGDFVLVIYIL